VLFGQTFREKEKAMKHRFFQIPTHGGEPEQELNQFLGTHRIVGIDRQFVDNGLNSFWALCVRYLDGSETPALLQKGKVDYREILNADDFALFAKLRLLRKEISEQDGVPPYALFTNEQLALMIRKKVRTKEDMGEIDGIGPARLDKYSARFLAVLQTSQGDNPAP
jgi:superfamily II DNA helicase RecQ